MKDFETHLRPRERDGIVEALGQFKSLRTLFLRLHSQQLGGRLAWMLLSCKEFETNRKASTVCDLCNMGNKSRGRPWAHWKDEV